MMTVFNKQDNFLIALCLVNVVLHAQARKSLSKSFGNFQDSLVKNEMVAFTKKLRFFLKKTDSISNTRLVGIPISNCTGDEVNFSSGTSSSMAGTFIHLYFKDKNSDKILNSIFLVTHDHFRVKIPTETFQGLYQSNSCALTQIGKKSTLFSPYYKAFYSLDKNRLYIYMQGGSNTKKYEVTWAIVNDKYYSRTIDTIF